jgi:hypothetical protein
MKEMRLFIEEPHFLCFHALDLSFYDYDLDFGVALLVLKDIRHFPK